MKEIALHFMQFERHFHECAWLHLALSKGRLLYTSLRRTHSHKIGNSNVVPGSVANLGKSAKTVKSYFIV